jgi:integrase
MGKEKSKELTDKGINGLIAAREPFEVCDGGGLWLRLREGAVTPVFRFRYRYARKARVMVLGSYGTLSLAEARKTARELRARVSLKQDIAAEAEQRERDRQAADEAKHNVYTVAKLADDFYRRKVLGKVKHPGIVRARIEKDIKPNIGRIAVADVKPRDIRTMLEAVVERGAPTVANDVLRVSKRIFNEAVKDGVIEYNPASAYDYSDAGGTEEARERALSRDELVRFFAAMRKTPGLSIENVYTFKLLLLLCVRKGELIMAPVKEFDLKAAMWALPAERTKTGVAIDIPLSPAAVASLRELVRLGEGSDYLLPARKSQDRMLPHIHENTLNVALSKVRKAMGIKDADSNDSFTIHDLRRTARTHLSALKVLPHVAEKCLNHRTPGVAGTYDRHDYYEERRDALTKWATFLDGCEKGTRA